MKKLIYLFLTVLIVACSSDDSNSNEPPQIPQNFYEAHNGAWITTFSDLSQTLLDINDSGIAAYFRTTNSAVGLSRLLWEGNQQLFQTPQKNC